MKYDNFSLEENIVDLLTDLMHAALQSPGPHYALPSTRDKMLRLMTEKLQAAHAQFEAELDDEDQQSRLAVLREGRADHASGWGR
jgi:hypothetical protein